MTSNDERDAIFQMHPVHLRRVAFATRSSEELHATIDVAIRSRSKGMVVLAPPLTGLTTAMRMISGGWSELHPTVPLVLVRQAALGKFDYVRFWRSTVGQIAPMLEFGRSPEALRRRLLQNLATRCLKLKSDRLVFVVDSAHNLLAEEITQLTNFQDDLADDGVFMTLVMQGYPSLTTIRDALHDEARDEPVRRYFEKEHRFFGIRTAEDLMYFLESFDKTRFPLKSEWTVSRFFFRDAFDRGWRLAHEAARAWSVVAQAAATAKVTTEVEMQYVTEIVCTVLEKAYARGANALPPDDTKWMEAVKSSGLLEARALMAHLNNRAIKKENRQ
jgi:hypothetical protein